MPVRFLYVSAPAHQASSMKSTLKALRTTFLQTRLEDESNRAYEGLRTMKTTMHARFPFASKCNLARPLVHTSSVEGGARLTSHPEDPMAWEPCNDSSRGSACPPPLDSRSAQTAGRDQFLTIETAMPTIWAIALDEIRRRIPSPGFGQAFRFSPRRC